ncbi:OprD family porin [Pseudomonas chlororaphis]|uniref:OprD family porin n=1 Tax=Pseudomonas chlororaphis TaxID=587753 RepID=UPI0014739614|nr:OprD family porin [Pseudomonas chlororaphis]NNB43120.1 OprD family porin [Pseudomonas chlororaphis]
MPLPYPTTVLGLSLLGASALVQAQNLAQNQAGSAGLLEDSSLKLTSRNFYFNRDFRSDLGPTSLREEWAQGFILDLRSGYTQGVLGVGVDAFGMLGLRLDGSRRRSPVMLIPTDSHGNPEQQWAEAGGALKLRWSATELKYGDLMPNNPVFAMATARLLPSSAQGLQLLSGELPGLNLDAGHFTSGNGVNSTNRDGPLSAFYARLDVRRVDYLGGFYQATPRLKLGAFSADYQDVWRQHFVSAEYRWPIDAAHALSLALAGYHTRDSGKALAGPIDNNAWSASLAYAFDPHKLTLARQVIDGDEPFDYLGFGAMPGDAIGFLANKSQNADFNLPHERSWQLRYDLNLAAFGIPGLSLMGRYLSSSGIDGSGYGGGAYDRFKAIDDGGRWERDLEARYVVQSGPARDLSLRVRQATLRSDAAVQRADLPDLDEWRVIVEYPLSF